MIGERVVELAGESPHRFVARRTHRLVELHGGRLHDAIRLALE